MLLLLEEIQQFVVELFVFLYYLVLVVLAPPLTTTVNAFFSFRVVVYQMVCKLLKAMD